MNHSAVLVTTGPFLALLVAVVAAVFILIVVVFTVVIVVVVVVVVVTAACAVDAHFGDAWALELACCRGKQCIHTVPLSCLFPFFCFLPLLFLLRFFAAVQDAPIAVIDSCSL